MPEVKPKLKRRGDPAWMSGRVDLLSLMRQITRRGYAPSQHTKGGNMDAYTYNAALYCDTCASSIKGDIRALGREDTGDSEDWPQGPYSQGGGEADNPRHCDECNKFLRNPLTPDGRDYVVETYLSADSTKTHPVLMKWVDYYGIPSEVTAREIVASLDPSDFAFHAARYEAGKYAQEAVRLAKKDEGGSDWSYQLTLAFDADEGLMPCMGGISLDKLIRAHNRM